MKDTTRQGRFGWAWMAMCVAALGTPMSAWADEGALSQPSGLDGCVSDNGSGVSCIEAEGIKIPRDIVASQDGRHVYVVAGGVGDGILALTRNRSTGALAPLPGSASCITGAGGPCRQGVALVGLTTVAMTRDGRNVYATAEQSNAVAAFARDTATGELTQLPGQDGCTSNDGTAGACRTRPFLEIPSDVAVSPDGRHVYVVSFGSDSLLAFKRNATTGALTQVAPDGCHAATPNILCGRVARGLEKPSSIVVSKDGRHVYVTSKTEDAVTLFVRDPDTGVLTQPSDPAIGCVREGGLDGCTPGRGLEGPVEMVLSPDGSFLYAVAPESAAIAVFRRDRLTGALTQSNDPSGCVSADGSGGTCTSAIAINNPRAITITPNGRMAYVAALNSNAVAAFSRDRRTGALTQLPGLDACIGEAGVGGLCTVGRALLGPQGIVASPKGRHVYAVSFTGVAKFDRE